MKKPYYYFKQLLLLIIVSLVSSSFISSISIAENIDEIKPPFGLRHYDIGKAPDFILNDIDGEKFQLSEARGRWIFLHFWASWCGPCREEMPAVQRLDDIFQKDELEIVMVNTAEDEDTIFEFLAAINVELNSLLDSDGQVTEVWKPRGLPTSFLINPKGEVKYQAIGGREWDKTEYVQFIRRLIATSK
jgi:thiol-disulfide isomerase/thioredoxin